MSLSQFTRSVRSLNRLRQIAQVLTRHGFGHIVTQIDLTRFVPVWMLRKKVVPPPLDDQRSPVGKRLVQVSVELGPTFIKLGQMLSARPDVVPGHVLQELRSLQDDVPPFDTSTAMDILAHDLERPIDECFSWIADAPLASASIGQVYRAKAHDGADLMVKIQRPGIGSIIELDMQLLRWLAESLENLVPELRMYRPMMIVDELDQMLHRELDYINEASTTTRFGEAFADDPAIRIPRVYWEFSGAHVLTLEALEGTKIDRIETSSPESDGGIDRGLVARRLANCYLKQIFELGMFHADPHPGNILVSAPASIGLLDFGQIGVIGDEFMTELTLFLYACANNEMEIVVDTFADSGALGRDTDRRNLRRALQILYDKYRNLPAKRIDLGTLFGECSEVMRRNDVILPRDLSVLIKTLGGVATEATRLDPNLQMFDLLRPYVKKVLSERLSPSQLSRSAAMFGWDLLNIVRKAPRQLRESLRRIASHGLELHVRHENIDRLTKELDRSSNRLAFAIVIAGIIVGSSAVFSAAADVTLLGFEVRWFGIIGYLMAGVLGLALSWAIFRSGRLH